MSTLDTTVSMIQKCTEEELQVVQQVIRQFFLNRGPRTTTKKQFLEELQISRRQHQNGQSQESSEALAELREKYGLLAQVGGSLKICEEPELADYGYRKMHFLSHRYLMLYTINGNSIHVDRIYHELEDYKNLPD